MRLTPIELVNKRFPKAVRGYAPGAVEDFLREVEADYHAVVAENARLQDKVEALERELERYQAIEETLKRALVLAEKTAGETCEAARRDADRIVKDAQERGEAIRGEAERGAHEMLQRRARFAREFRALLESYLADLAQDPCGRSTALTEDPHGDA